MAEGVGIKTRFTGASDEAKGLFEKRVQGIERKLDASPELRALVMAEPLAFFASQGLLEGATELSFSLREGTLADVALMRSALRHRPGLAIGGGALGFTIGGCIVLKGDDWWVEICITVSW